MSISSRVHHISGAGRDAASSVSVIVKAGLTVRANVQVPTGTGIRWLGQKRDPPANKPEYQSCPMDQVLLACLARSNSDSSSSILRRGKLFFISVISIFDCCGAILLAADDCMIFPEHGFFGDDLRRIKTKVFSWVYGII